MLVDVDSWFAFAESLKLVVVDRDVLKTESREAGELVGEVEGGCPEAYLFEVEVLQVHKRCELLDSMEACSAG